MEEKVNDLALVVAYLIRSLTAKGTLSVQMGESLSDRLNEIMHGGKKDGE